MNVGTRTCQLSFDQITSVCVSLCCRRPWCDAVAVCVSCHMAYSVLLVMQCTVAFRWCILSLPTLYIPLLDSSSGGGNRMCSCVDPFFSFSRLSSFLPCFSLWLVTYLHLATPTISSASRWYCQFVYTNFIWATYSKKHYHFCLPHYFLHISFSQICLSF